VGDKVCWRKMRRVHDSATRLGVYQSLLRCGFNKRLTVVGVMRLMSLASSGDVRHVRSRLSERKVR
jgi:hypothetical protein